MRSILAALAFTCVAGSASATQVADPSWSAGYEAAYLNLCDVTPTERAAWASPVSLAPVDPAAFTEGFEAAIEDADAYEEAGFDRYEFCGDNHP